MATLQPYKKYNSVAYDYATELPDGWQLLPNIAIFQERIERGYENEELLSVTIGRGVIKQSDLDKKDSSTLDKSKYLLVCPDDLVYSMRFRQGASGYSNYKGIVSPACTVLKPRKNLKYNPRYFHYMFRTGFYKNYAERYAYGIADGQMPLRYFDFKRMYSIVPPLEVQNTIVAYLDKKNSEIDKFIQNKERLIELLEEEKKSIIINGVSKGIAKVELADFGNDWLGPLPKHWKIKRNKLLFRKTKNIIGNKSSDYKVLSLSVNGVIERDLESNFGKMPTTFDDYQVIYTDTLLMCLFDIDVTPRGVGYVGQVGITSAAYTNLIKVDKDINLEYYYYWFLSLDFNKRLLQFATNLRNTVLMDVFGALYSPYPPKDEQIEIVNYIKFEVEKVENAIKNAKAEIISIKEYRESLITDLVTGKRSFPQYQMN
jgi:type I restriction enzyme S subunit